MRIYLKIFTFLLVLCMAVPTALADNISYADELFELKLFCGTENGYELQKTFTREEAATMLVRLLGEEEGLSEADYTQQFADVEPGRWSYAYVMYCYINGITKGTSLTNFTPEADISAQEFITLVLRMLGYNEAEPETAFADAVTYGLINSRIAKALQSKDEFLRDDMVYVVHRSLKTKSSGGTILARILAGKGVITDSEADKFDFYSADKGIDEILNGLLN